jgi:2-polyprenyl-3-methyl-5-hydroxy-6-metoxy-1,4-benzoquinol methylase
MNKGFLKIRLITYHLKKLINNILKSVHNLLYFFGIDIRLRRKEVHLNAIEFNSIDEVNKYYKSPEKQFEIVSSRHQKFFHEIITILENTGISLSGKKIADFGCGIGNLLFHVNNHFKPVKCTGFDFSEVLLELASKRLPEGEFIKHDIYNPVNREYDFVFCTEVIEHLLYPDLALSNILKSVHSGGAAFISVPDGRKDTYSGHINFWSPESWNVFIKNHLAGNYSIQTGYVTPNNLFALIEFKM